MACEHGLDRSIVDCRQCEGERATLRQVVEERAVLRSLLQEIESKRRHGCPICNMIYAEGHYADCRLMAALRG